MALTNPESADHIAAEAGSFEPQRQSNYSVEIALGAADKDLVIMGANAFTLPRQGNEIIEVMFQNERRKVAGQATVEEGSITLHDFVDADTRGAILRWRKQVYDPDTGKVGLAKDYKKQLYLVLTGPDGSGDRIAKCKGCWPTADPTFEGSMEASEKVLMEVPLSVDKVSWSDSISGA